MEAAGVFGRVERQCASGAVLSCRDFDSGHSRESSGARIAVLRLSGRLESTLGMGQDRRDQADTEFCRPDCPDVSGLGKRGCTCFVQLAGDVDQGSG